MSTRVRSSIYLVAVPEDTFTTEVARLITFQATKAVAKDHCTPVVILLKLLAQPKINWNYCQMS